jgi:hypothetical protein
MAGKGGARPGAGRPRRGQERPRKSKSRWVIETRMNELLALGTMPAKQEAARLAVQLLPYDEPRLNAVMAKTEITHHYVARIPEQIVDVDEWQTKARALITYQKKP